MRRKEVVGINLLRGEAKKPVSKKRIRGKPAVGSPLGLDRDSYIIIAVFLVFVVAFVGYYLRLNSVIKSKEKMLVAKKSELKRLEKVYARIKLLEMRKKNLQRMVKVIQTLSSGRDRMVKFFEDLEGAIPDNAWLNSLALKGNSVQMMGYSLEDNGVADFMDNLTKIKDVKKCSLKYIKETSLAGMRVKRFSLTTFLK